MSMVFTTDSPSVDGGRWYSSCTHRMVKLRNWVGSKTCATSATERPFPARISLDQKRAYNRRHPPYAGFPGRWIPQVALYTRWNDK